MFNEKLNEIGFRRKSILTLGFDKTKNNNKTLLIALMKELENLGYMLDKPLYEYLLNINEDDLKTVYEFLIKNINDLKGNVNYKSFYPNFPKQVEEASEFELYLNAIVHYWTWGTWIPEFQTELREKLKGEYKLDTIYLGSEKSYIEIGQNLFNSKLVYSNSDKEDLAVIIEKYKNQLVLPEKITNKENLIFIIEEYRKNNLDLTKLFKTATDVLRYVIALQDGDISLTEKHKFKAINRPTRRFMLGVLNNIKNPLEDMYRHRDAWLRLAEKLHPYDYKVKYDKAFENICYIRENVRYKESFNHYVHEYLENKDFEKLCEHLSKRPSEFGRRLNEVLQHTDDKDLVLESFENIAPKISSNVLISIYNFFSSINEISDRFFVLKGVRARTYAVSNEVSLPKIYVEKVRAICKESLLKNFETKSKLGKVFIDEEIQTINIPNQNRTASKGFKILTKGSKIKLDTNKDIIRLFCYWKNHNDERTDIDLSIILYNKSFQYVDHISYSNLKSNKFYAVHSGDIVDAPDGASEYIDLSISDLLKYGVRYVMVNINMFSGALFSEMDVCGAGYMQREDKYSGEIFEPKTVKAHYKVQTDGRISCPFVLDVYNEEVIWTDMNLQGKVSCNAVENNLDKEALRLRNMVQKSEMSLYELIELNARVRGEIIIENKDDIFECDTIYTSDKDLLLETLSEKLTTDEIKAKTIVSIYDIDVLLGDLM